MNISNSELFENIDKLLVNTLKMNLPRKRFYFLFFLIYGVYRVCDFFENNYLNQFKKAVIENNLDDIQTYISYMYASANSYNLVLKNQMKFNIRISKLILINKFNINKKHINFYEDLTYNEINKNIRNLNNELNEIIKSKLIQNNVFKIKTVNKLCEKTFEIHINIKIYEYLIETELPRIVSSEDAQSFYNFLLLIEYQHKKMLMSYNDAKYILDKSPDYLD